MKHVNPTVFTNQIVVDGGMSNTKVKIVDQGCGSGKTSTMIRSFVEAERYLVVVPFISECERIIAGTQEEYREDFFVQPAVSRDFPTKGQHLEHLLTTDQNIVTTHELYLSIVVSAQRGDLHDRHLIIDEVLSVVDVKPGPKQDVWKDFFVDKGYARVCEATGKIIPSDLWRDDYEAVDFKDLYRQASTGCLYLVDNSFYVWSLPASLLNRAKTTTIYTFLSDGSYMKHWLLKENMHVTQQPAWQLEQHLKEFKAQTKRLLTLKSIPAIEKLNFSNSGQKGMNTAQRNRVNTALRKLNSRDFKGVPKENILITCNKSLWYKKEPTNADKTNGTAGAFSRESGVFKGTNWCSNITRGTNEYSHCTHAIYLYDQYPNPGLLKYLDIDNTRSKEDYAICELIQWLYRTQIRKRKPVTLYLPSERMRRILQDWLDS